MQVSNGVRRGLQGRGSAMEFLGLTGPVLALCVEVDRGGCELRYADPFPGSHHRMLPVASTFSRSRAFFLALPVCSGNLGRYSRTR
jgi:hypothetical protein